MATCNECDVTENVVEIRKDLALCHDHARVAYGIVGSIMVGVPPLPEHAYHLSMAGLWTGYDSEGDYYSGIAE